MKQTVTPVQVEQVPKMNREQRRAAKHQKPMCAHGKGDKMAVPNLISKIQPFNEAELLALDLPIRISFEALRTGKGTYSDWSDIVAAINTTVIRSRTIDPQCEQVAGAASDALVRMWHRAQATGRWGFDGPGISEVEAGIELHEQLCRLSTPLQMLDAMREVLAIRATSQPVMRAQHAQEVCA